MKEMKDFKSKVDILKSYGFKQKRDLHGGKYYERVIKDDFFGKFTLEVEEENMKEIRVVIEKGSLTSNHSIHKFNKLEWILDKFAKLKM